MLGFAAFFLSACAQVPLAPDVSLDLSASKTSMQKTAHKRQPLILGEVYYQYFLEQPSTSLLAIELAKHNATLSQQEYAQIDRDRLDLMQGSASLQLGMVQQAEHIFKRLLDQSKDPYIRANTWFWLAKSSFSQKRYDVIERAYSEIQATSSEEDLVKYLRAKDWQELLYQVAYIRQLKEEDWLSIADQIPLSSIYRTYLTANNAIKLHNQGQLVPAQEALVRAKQQLLALPNNEKNNLTDNALLDELSEQNTWRWYNPLSWFSDSQDDTEAKYVAAIQLEKNALFDRLNYAIGTNLLAQKDYTNSLAALQLIGIDSIQSEQALLTFAWTLARENRWPMAMAVWQYLRTNNDGIYALQASYGMAYGYEQQGALAQAYFALRHGVST